MFSRLPRHSSKSIALSGWDSTTLRSAESCRAGMGFRVVKLEAKRANQQKQEQKRIEQVQKRFDEVIGAPQLESSQDL